MSVAGRGGEGQDQTDTLTGSSEDEKRCFQMQVRARFLCGERSCHQEGELALRSAATFSLSCPDAQICLRQTAVRCQSVSLGLWEDSLTLLLRPASGGGQHPLQEVQLQRLVQRHQVAVGGDPPEGHVVLGAEREKR